MQHLRDYLDAQTDNEIGLSFVQVEEILRGRLPESASVYDAWWSNSPVAGRHNDVWLSCGWETVGLNREAETVRFVRSPSPRTIRANPKPRGPTPIQPSSPSLETAPVAASNDVTLSFEWKVLGEIMLDMECGLVFPAVTLGAGLYRRYHHGRSGADHQWHGDIPGPCRQGHAADDRTCSDSRDWRNGR